MIFLSTVIPDEAIVAVLGTILVGGGSTITFLWRRVNRLQATVARLTVVVELYRNCPVQQCPTHERVKKADLSDLKEVGA